MAQDTFEPKDAGYAQRVRASHARVSVERLSGVQHSVRTQRCARAMWNA